MVLALTNGIICFLIRPLDHSPSTRQHKSATEQRSQYFGLPGTMRRIRDG